MIRARKDKYILRMDYKSYKKKKFQNLLIQKYINIFLSLRKLKRNLNLEIERFVVFII